MFKPRFFAKAVQGVALASLIFLGGCYKDDIDDLEKRVNEQEKKVADLISWQTNVNNDIASLKGLLNAVESGDYVTKVEETADGYRISFKEGASIVIKHGTDGKNGTDGVDGTGGSNGADGTGSTGETPQMGVKLVEGVYYWTVTVGGETSFVEDEDGEPLPATGPQGETPDAVIPIMQVREGYDGAHPTYNTRGWFDENDVYNESPEDHYWQISTDGGEMFTDVLYHEDHPTLAGYPVKANGEHGGISDVEETDDGFVIFTLTNGDEIKLPKWTLIAQSIVYIPEYEDGKVLVKGLYNGDKFDVAPFAMDFMVAPAVAAVAIEEAWTNEEAELFGILNGVKKTRAIQSQSASVTGVEVIDETNGILRVTFDLEELTAEQVAILTAEDGDDENFLQIALKVTIGGDDAQSGFVTLLAGMEPLSWDNIQSAIDGMNDGGILDLSELPAKNIYTSPLHLTLSRDITITAGHDPVNAEWSPFSNVYFELENNATVTFKHASFNPGTEFQKALISGSGNVVVRESKISHVRPIDIDGDVTVYGDIAELYDSYPDDGHDPSIDHTSRIYVETATMQGGPAADMIYPAIKARNVTLNGGAVNGGWSSKDDIPGGNAIEASGDVTITGEFKLVGSNTYYLASSLVFGGDGTFERSNGGHAIVAGGKVTVTGSADIQGGRGAGVDDGMWSVSKGGTGGSAIVASGDITLSGERVGPNDASSVRVVSGEGGYMTGIAIRFTTGSETPRTLTATTAYIRNASWSEFDYNKNGDGWEAEYTIVQGTNDSSLLTDCLVGWSGNQYIFSGGRYKIVNAFRTYGKLDNADEIP